jgi:ribosomal protein L31E
MDMPNKGHGMNIARSIKLIKKAARKHLGRESAVVELAINPNRWSSAVLDR